MKQARLILGGGSAYGLAHMGVIAAVREHFEISGIVGTSMGAIIGACAAWGIPPEQMLSMAQDISTLELFSPLHLDFSRAGIFDGKAVRKLFAGWVSSANIQDCRIPFVAIAYDLIRKRSILIDKGPLADAMRASSSLPFIFAPHQIGDYLLVDGGVAHPLPLAFAHKVPGDITIAVNVLPPMALKAEVISLKPSRPKERITRYDVFMESLMQNQGFIAVQAATQFKPDIYIDAYHPNLKFTDLKKAATFYEHGFKVANTSLAAYSEADFPTKLKETYEQLKLRLKEAWR